MKNLKNIKCKTLYNANKKPAGIVIDTKTLNQLYEACEDYSDYLTVIKRSGKKEKTYTLDEVEHILRNRK